VSVFGRVIMGASKQITSQKVLMLVILMAAKYEQNAVIFTRLPLGDLPFGIKY